MGYRLANFLFFLFIDASLAGPATRCIATPPTSGGIKESASCKFPFAYKGQKYNKCISTDVESITWCATKTDSNDAFVEPDWGWCPDSCGGNTIININDDNIKNVSSRRRNTRETITKVLQGGKFIINIKRKKNSTKTTTTRPTKLTTTTTTRRSTTTTKTTWVLYPGSGGNGGNGGVGGNGGIGGYGGFGGGGWGGNLYYYYYDYE